MKVSFDFDGVLSKTYVQKYAKELVDRGIDVWIVTTRWNRLSRFYDKDYYKLHGNWSWKEVHDVALKIGVPIKNIVFTNYEWKSTYFYHVRDFAWHLDDNIEEHHHLKGIIPCVICNGGNWKAKCERLLINNL